MRYRSVPPAFWQDERVGALSANAKLLLLCMNNLTDAHGRFRLDARFLRAQAFAFEPKPPSDRDMGVMLDLLIRSRLVESYEHDGRMIGSIPYDDPTHPLSQYARSYRNEQERLPPPQEQPSLFSGGYHQTRRSHDGRTTVARRSHDRGIGIRDQGLGERELSAPPAPTPVSDPPDANGTQPKPNGNGNREREPLPHPLGTYLDAIGTASAGRVHVAPFAKGLAKPLTATVRDVPNLADWTLAGEWIAAGGLAWMHDAPGLPWLATSGRLPDAVARARAWDASGRSVIGTGQAARGYAPVADWQKGEGGFET